MANRRYDETLDPDRRNRRRRAILRMLPCSTKELIAAVMGHYDGDLMNTSGPDYRQLIRDLRAVGARKRITIMVRYHSHVRYEKDWIVDGKPDDRLPEAERERHKKYLAKRGRNRSP